MTQDDYQIAVKRTQPDDQLEIAQARRLRERASEMHAIIGLCTEAGELQDAYKKHIFYGRPLDTINIREEIGDIAWYLAFLCNEHGWSLSQIMADNIAKLKARYPDKFTESDAIERKDKAET